MIEHLKKILSQEDAVLFIGSGISLWSGLPTWPGLIEQLACMLEAEGQSAELVRREAGRDLLQAASYGFDRLTKPQIGKFIRTACQYGTAEPADIHKKIVSLGPRCFITTNYDDLLEKSLRKWQPDRFYRAPITNRHLTEIADIVHARAIDYIFKPHGDAGDIESIVLTREQYRTLLPQGGKYSALETLKMIMTTRPVVYLGFGLRDPDFLYVRDLLANTYHGGARDHYAVMADVTKDEADFWRKEYGIHLITYATIERADKSRDHTSLLMLLDSLAEKPSVKKEDFNPHAPHIILALARYAAGLTNVPRQAAEFEIRVHRDNPKEDLSYFRGESFNHKPVGEFLTNGPPRALLVGLPGAGKTYALRGAVARLAEQLRGLCLSEDINKQQVVVPLFADFKLYKGDIGQLIAQSLPPDIPLEELIQHFNVKIFIDSFNEMPREYWENGSYEADMERFIKSIGASPLIIGSRTNDGLSKLDLPTYNLDQIDREAVITTLSRMKVGLTGIFTEELYTLLQRPFYFQYILSGKVTLSGEAHPRDFYQALFANVRQAFYQQFNINIDVVSLLAITAYNTLNCGAETLLQTELLHVLKIGLQEEGVNHVAPRDIVNWLINYAILVPYTGGRLAFVHQSITEYLAATALARQYDSNPSILKEKLRLTRWDQALFLTLSLLNPDQAALFLQHIIAVDFVLALNAAKYLETSRDEVIRKLLSEVPNQLLSRQVRDWIIGKLIADTLPINAIHEQELRMLLKQGGHVGGAAATRIIQLKGEAVKAEMLRMMFDNHRDYSMCTMIGEALAKLAQNEDIGTIVELLGQLPLDHLLAEENDNILEGVIEGISNFLERIDLDIIVNALLPSGNNINPTEKICNEIFYDTLRDRYSTTALVIAGDLLLNGLYTSGDIIYFIASNFEDEKCEHTLCWDSFNELHINRLIEALLGSAGYWEVNALTYICSARPDLAKHVLAIAEGKQNLEKAVILYTIPPNNLDVIFNVLSEMTEMGQDSRDKIPVHVIKGIHLDWEGRTNLFVKLLLLRDLKMANAILPEIVPVFIRSIDLFDTGPIEWWLQWLTEIIDNNDYWTASKIGSVIANCTNPSSREMLLAEFNKSDSTYRAVLRDHILSFINDITTDHFSENAISYLLSNLNSKVDSDNMRGPFLGQTATERFINERLLPLLPDAKGILLQNLQNILKHAGRRHGKRYC